MTTVNGYGRFGSSLQDPIDTLRSEGYIYTQELRIMVEGGSVVEGIKSRLNSRAGHVTRRGPSARLLVAVMFTLVAAACSPTKSQPDNMPTVTVPPSTTVAQSQTTLPEATTATPETSDEETSRDIVILESSSVDAADGASVKIAGVLVTAPPGAIPNGQSLSVALVQGGPPPPEGVVDVGVGMVDITTSAGQPTAPVKIEFPFDPELISEGSEPAVLHYYESVGQWLLEETLQVDRSENTISVEIDSFSVLFVVDLAKWSDLFSFVAQNLLGNRSDTQPDDCDRPRPEWITNTHLYRGLNDPVRGCAHESSAGVYKVSLVSNRGYPQLIEVSGLVPSQLSHGFDVTLESASSLGARIYGSALYLAPGTKGSLVVERPAETAGPTTVALSAKVDKTMLAIYMVRDLAEQTLDIVNVAKLNRLLISCFESTVNLDFRSMIVECSLPALEEVTSGIEKTVLKKLLLTYLATKYASQFIDMGFNAAMGEIGSFEVAPVSDTEAVVPEKGKINVTQDDHSWYLDRRGYRHDIRDGGTFECLASQGIDVLRDVEIGRIQAFKKAEDAECVRVNDGDIVSTDDGDSYVMESSKRRWIPTGEVFQCEVAAGRKVVESVPRYWIEDTVKGTEYPYRCAATPTTTTTWTPTTTPLPSSTTTTVPETTTTTKPDVLPQRGMINRTSAGNSWYIDPRGYRHSIPDGGTYECLVAQGKQVVNDVKQWRIEAFSAAENAECVRASNGDIVKTDDGDSYVYESGKRRWIPDSETYNCETALGRRVVASVPRYWIEDTPQGSTYPLRCQPQKGKINESTDGSSWYIDPRGYRHHIPNGGTYDCLVAQGYAVQKGVDRSRINAFTRTEDAQCVRANSGDIIRHSDGDAYLLSGGKRRWITNGVTYNCLVSAGRKVVNNVPRYYIDDLPKGTNYQTTCFPYTAYNKIIKHPDGDSYLVDGSGFRHWIPDTATYRCRTYQGTAVMTVTRTQINSLAEKGWDYCNNKWAWVGMILRHQIDGDSHYIDGAAYRHWIPDGGVYNCLVGRGIPVVNTRYRQYIDSIPELGWQACP